MSGRFIVLEGIDGSGKGTQLALLAERLTNAGHSVWLTREPTDGASAVSSAKGWAMPRV